MSFSHHSFSILLLDEYTEEIMLTKATNHFKLPVTSNRATTTSRYIKVTSRPITFPQKTNSQTFPQKTNTQIFPQKTHSHFMKHVSFPSTTNLKKVVNQQPKRRTDSNSGAIIFNQPITTPQTTFRLPGKYVL
jgi:vancomycin resistance protein YoaR